MEWLTIGILVAVIIHVLGYFWIGRIRTLKRIADENLRELDGLERQFVRLGHKYNGQNQAGLVIEADGKITLEELKQAVEKAGKKHPMLRAVLVDYGHVAVKDEIQVEFLELRRPDENAWPSIVAPMLKDPVKFGTSPFRLILLKGDDDACEIVLLGHHYGCDGVSLGNLVNDIMAGLTSTTTKDHQANVISMDSPLMCVKSSLPGLVTRSNFVLNYLRVATMALLRPGAMWTVSKSADRSSFDLPPIIGKRKFITNISRLAKLSKEKHGVTLNSVLCVACKWAAANCINKDRELKILTNVAVNLRPRYDNSVKVQDSCLGVHASALFQPEWIHAAKMSTDDLWELTGKFADDLNRNLEERTMFGPVIAAPWLWYSLPMDDVSPTIIISNWGRIPIAAQYADKLRIKHVVPVINMTMFASPYIAFSTANDTLEISVCGSRRQVSKADVDKLTDEIYGTIIQMMNHYTS